MSKKYIMCKQCVMDTTDPEIFFDDEGICNHCRRYELLKNSYPHNLNEKEKKRELQKSIEKMKNSGKNKKYDCVIGVSGGVDSTYLAYLTKKFGLRPLAVHLDNGWNSELAVNNIEKCLRALGIDLETIVLDWEEFKDLQLAFLKASVPDVEIPTDHAIIASLYKVASKYNIKYIVLGVNFSTESVLPRMWSHGHNDWKYIKSIYRTFGNRKKLDDFPHLSLADYFYYIFIKRIKIVKLLDFVKYDKKEAIEILKKFGWKPYGYKHYESIYTRFVQGYYLPKKFNYDKRKAHLSSLILSGQITREEALKELKKNPYPSRELEEEDKRYVLKKLNLTEKEFEKIMKMQPKHFWDYPSYEKMFIYKIMLWIYKKLGNRMKHLYID